MKPISFLRINIAVLGGTKLSELLAFSLARLGYTVCFGVKNEDRRKYQLLGTHTNISLCTIEDASLKSDIILLASLPENIRELAYFIDDVKEKVVVDLSSFVSEKKNKEINTLRAIKVITGSDQVVKCYGAIKNYHHANFFSGKNIQELFVAGACRKSKIAARLLFHEMGVGLCHDIGNDEVAHLVDSILTSDIKAVAG